MSLALQIENYHTLHDGGAPRMEVPDNGLAVGRSHAMGWVLPDASRHISGHHFDVFRDARGWWLRDVSTNGTFLQGQRYRLDGPHWLQDGDRFQVGQYIIVARIQEDAVAMGGGLERIDPLPARPLLPYGELARDDIPTSARQDAPVSAEQSAQPTAPGSVGRLRGAASTPLRMSEPSMRETTGVKPPAAPQTETDFVRAFCKGAGLSPDLYTNVDPGVLALALGKSMHAVSRQIMMALQDRAAAKQFARTGERTTRAASDNNPLKFLPDPEQAVEAMFLKPRGGFLAGKDGLDEALDDLRLHQAALFAAMPPALSMLLSDLAPEGIEAEAETRRLGGNRKAMAWDMFVERWDAKAAKHENGMLDEFMGHFAASYRDVAGTDTGTGECETRAVVKKFMD